MSMPDTVQHYYFANKVTACAQAEEMATPNVRSLVWIDPECLIIKPPLLFDLGQQFGPVHIKNVGLSPEEPVDGFWQKIYEAVGVDAIQTAVETFVSGQSVRSYFNSHAFAINPACGLLRRWFEYFEALVCDEAHQMAVCEDELHQIFLHQAILSALLVAELEPRRKLIPFIY